MLRSERGPYARITGNKQLAEGVSIRKKASPTSRGWYFMTVSPLRRS